MGDKRDTPSNRTVGRNENGDTRVVVTHRDGSESETSVKGR